MAPPITTIHTRRILHGQQITPFPGFTNGNRVAGFTFCLISVRGTAAKYGSNLTALASVEENGAVYTYTTVITVTSGTDPDDSPSKTCYTDPYGPPGPPTSPFTLRRAIVEASALAESARPIQIRFNIPENVSDGWDNTLGIWKIVLDTKDTVALGRLKDGQIIIDGSTQPGGRSDGPKIIIVSPGERVIKMGW